MSSISAVYHCCHISCDNNDAKEFAPTGSFSTYELCSKIVMHLQSLAELTQLSTFKWTASKSGDACNLHHIHFCQIFLQAHHLTSFQLSKAICPTSWRRRAVKFPFKSYSRWTSRVQSKNNYPLVILWHGIEGQPEKYAGHWNSRLNGLIFISNTIMNSLRDGSDCTV